MPIKNAPKSLDIHCKWYYAFCDVISEAMGELIVVSDESVVPDDSHKGIFMFTGRGLFPNLEEAREGLGCGPLSTTATKEEKATICSQFKIRL